MSGPPSQFNSEQLRLKWVRDDLERPGDQTGDDASRATLKIYRRLFGAEAISLNTNYGFLPSPALGPYLVILWDPDRGQYYGA